jgi:hypothetical protein
VKHARSDYNRIQDPAVKDPSLLGEGCTPIGEDEPVFLVRAKDIYAPHMCLDYAARMDAIGNVEMAESARRQANLMFEWQQRHGSKAPDLPKPVAAKPKAGK